MMKNIVANMMSARFSANQLSTRRLREGVCLLKGSGASDRVHNPLDVHASASRERPAEQEHDETQENRYDRGHEKPQAEDEQKLDDPALRDADHRLRALAG